jgi:hypothetical protein
LASRTIKQASVSSTDQGGGKLRRVAVLLELRALGYGLLRMVW